MHLHLSTPPPILTNLLVICHYVNCCNYFKLIDGHSLFAEIHEADVGSLVEVVVPNIPEAEDQLLMMNKQIAVYVKEHGKDLGIDEQFLISS